MAAPGSGVTSIIAHYCAQLGAMGIRVEQAILFGSHARGEATEGKILTCSSYQLILSH